MQPPFNPLNPSMIHNAVEVKRVPGSECMDIESDSMDTKPNSSSGVVVV